MFAPFLVASALLISIGDEGLQLNDARISQQAQLSDVVKVLDEPVEIDGNEAAFKWDDLGIVADLAPGGDSGSGVERLTIYVRDSRSTSRPRRKFSGTLSIAGTTIDPSAQRHQVDKALRNAGFSCYKAEENRHCVKLMGNIGGHILAANLDAFGLASIQIGFADPELRKRLLIATTLESASVETRREFTKHRPPCVVLETVVVFDDGFQLFADEIRKATPEDWKSHEKRVNSLKASLEKAGKGIGIVRTPERCH